MKTPGVNRLGLLLAMTFIESLATVFVERGVYFLTKDRLQFSDVENLALALAFGAAYVVGALMSQPLSLKTRERRLLALTIVGQLLAHLVLAARPDRAVVYAGSTMLAWLNGLKWPIIESYVSAGRTASATAGAIGRFNVSWAAAVPVSLATAGPIIAAFPAALFIVPAALNAISLTMIAPLPAVPPYLSQGHPDRPAAVQLTRMRALMVSSRWLMLFSYAALWVLAALLPRIFQNLKFSVQAATPLAGLVDLARLAAFFALSRHAGWHYRARPLVLCLFALPAGFLMVLCGASTAVVLVGEVLFGFVAGVTYYAALYYAMVVKNAAVDAGGGHEGLIGLGFAVGPAAALIGTALAPAVGGELTGIIVGMGTVFVVCALGSILPLAANSRRSRSL